MYTSIAKEIAIVEEPCTEEKTPKAHFSIDDVGPTKTPNQEWVTGIAQIQ